MRIAVSGLLLGVILMGCGVSVQEEVEVSLTPSPEELPTQLLSKTATLSPTDWVTPTALPTQVDCDEEFGQILEASYLAKAVPGEIPLIIYTPPCYPAEGWRYPTLYLLHGFPYDEKQWINLGVLELANRDISSGKSPPFLVIMPRQPEPLFRSSDGGPGSYEDEFISNLVPFVDGNFPTQTEGSLRAIIGISRGGVWALEIGFRHPEHFSMVAAISPALAVNYSRPAYDPFVLAESQGPFPELTLLVAGDEDWASKETIRFSELLTEVNLLNELHIVSGGHDVKTWQIALDVILTRWETMLSHGF